MSSSSPAVLSFAPVLPPRPKILILGSTPSVRSLTAQQYYAHPRNMFWSILARLLQFDLNALAYERRLAQIKAAGIALWDVVGQCDRPGSADAAIDTPSVILNDVPALVAAHPSIACIYYNGQTAAKLAKPFACIRPSVVLPSTSAAHARMSFTDKLACWQSIITHDDHHVARH